MAQKLIDLSIFFENDVISDPPGYQPQIHYITHKDSAHDIAGIFPGLKAEDLPDAARKNGGHGAVDATESFDVTFVAMPADVFNGEKVLPSQDSGIRCATPAALSNTGPITFC